MADELFSQGPARVTKTLALLNNVSYPINGITAVFVKQKDLNLKALIGGGVIILIGLFLIQASILAALIAIAIGGGLIFLALQRPYFLILHTAGIDKHALESKDEQFINSVRTAIETAVAQRG